jgi:hypothetical protein
VSLSIEMLHNISRSKPGKVIWSLQANVACKLHMDQISSGSELEVSSGSLKQSTQSYTANNKVSVLREQENLVLYHHRTKYHWLQHNHYLQQNKFETKQFILLR